MKRIFSLAALMLPLTVFSGCRKTNVNHYNVLFKALRQNTLPAAGFRVDAWVKGRSEPKTKPTDSNGMATFDDLPAPDATHQLNTVLHYFMGKKDQSREIAYPFIESDAERLKDTQYIPNNAMPDPS